MSARLWLQLTLAQWRDQPLRTLVTLLAIAVGVALTSAVWFVNGGALAEFGQATRRLVGAADLVVRGPARSGVAAPASVLPHLAPRRRVALPRTDVAPSPARPDPRIVGSAPGGVRLGAPARSLPRPDPT